MTELNNNLKEETRTFIVTANPETFMLAEKDKELKNLLLDENTTIVPDGIGVVKAAKKLDIGVKERITGIDIANELLKIGDKQKKSIYFLASAFSFDTR